MPHTSIEIQLVKLTRGEYSVPHGTIGYAEQSTDSALWVSWTTGGSSGPIHISDVESIGSLHVRTHPAREEFLKAVLQTIRGIRELAEAGILRKSGVDMLEELADRIEDEMRRIQ